MEIRLGMSLLLEVVDRTMQHWMTLFLKEIDRF